MIRKIEYAAPAFEELLNVNPAAPLCVSRTASELDDLPENDYGEF